MQDLAACGKRLCIPRRTGEEACPTVGQASWPVRAFIRNVLCLIFCAALAAAQTPPPQDSRNTDIPDTDTHFYPKAFWRHASHGTRDQWEERKHFLRGQI